jgi:hypothetical protein
MGFENTCPSAHPHQWLSILRIEEDSGDILLSGMVIIDIDTSIFKSSNPWPETDVGQAVLIESLQNTTFCALL